MSKMDAFYDDEVPFYEKSKQEAYALKNEPAPKKPVNDNGDDKNDTYILLVLKAEDLIV